MSPKWIPCRTWVRGSMTNLLWPYTLLPEYQAFLGEKGKDGREKRRELKERNVWHRYFYWSLPPPHSMIRYHPERTWERPLESFWIPLCVSVYKSTTWNQNIYEKFQWLLLADRTARIYLRSVTSGVIVCYPITATSRFWMCHTICWMVLCQAFLSLLPPPPSPI